MNRKEKIKELKKQLQKLKREGTPTKAYACRKVRDQLRELGAYTFSEATRERIRQARLNAPEKENKSRGRMKRGRRGKK